MKRLVLSFIILLCSLIYAQPRGGVWSEQLRDSVTTRIADSLDAHLITASENPGMIISSANVWSEISRSAFQDTLFLLEKSVFNYIGTKDTSASWTTTIQAAIDDAQTAPYKTIVIPGKATPYLLTQVGANSQYAGHKYCLDLGTGNVSLIIEAGAILKLKDGQQVDGAPVDMIIFEDANNIYIGGGGEIQGNTAGQSGWTGGYQQITNGLIISGSVSVFGTRTNNNITIEGLRLNDHFSNPVNITGGTDVTLRDLSTYGVGEGFQVRHNSFSRNP